MNKYKKHVKIAINSSMLYIVMDKLVEKGYDRLNLSQFDKQDTIIYLFCYNSGHITWSRFKETFRDNDAREIFLSDLSITTKKEIYGIY